MQLLLVRLIFSSSVAFGEWEQLTIDDTPKKNKLIAQRVREGSVVGGSGGTKFSVREEGRDCMYYGRGSAWGLESILLLQGATASSTLVGFESKLELATVSLAVASLNTKDREAIPSLNGVQFIFSYGSLFYHTAL